MSNWPCTRCGSRNWPSPDTSCPLCYEEAVIESLDDLEIEEQEEEQP